MLIEVPRLPHRQHVARAQLRSMHGRPFGLYCNEAYVSWCVLQMVLDRYKQGHSSQAKAVDEHSAHGSFPHTRTRRSCLRHSATISEVSQSATDSAGRLDIYQMSSLQYAQHRRLERAVAKRQFPQDHGPTTDRATIKRRTHPVARAAIIVQRRSGMITCSYL